MGKTRAECSQNAYTSHASAFLSHWIQILANSSPKSDIKKKKNPTLFFHILRSVGRGQHNKFFFGLNCILRSLWKHLKPSKLQRFSTICSLWTTHQIILHDFTSGGRKVALHNAVPRCTTVPRGTAWCITSWKPSISLKRHKTCTFDLLSK